MGPSVAGRGSPRPLLDGVFRKACDYCVRSKRGCNGGTPCEQCVRRGQDCTYSQRRKSGPRGRPLRPQQAISAPPPGSPNAAVVVGTRTSARRAASKRVSSSSSSHDKASPSPSPSRTASMSSSSSDFSEGGDDAGAYSDESSDMEEVEQQQKQKHAHKKSKISREETVTGHHRGSSSPRPPPPPPTPEVSARGGTFVAKQAGPRTRTRGGAGAAATTTAAAEEKDVKQEQQLTVAAAPAAAAAAAASSPSFLNEPASYLAKNKIISGDRAAPPRQHSPLTVGAPALSLQLQRSSSLPTWARETSTDAEQRRQQVHRYSASVGAVPTMSTTTTTASSSRGDKAIHEITMQPWEDARPLAPQRPVTLVNIATQQQQQQQEEEEAQAHQAPAFAVAGGSGSGSSGSSGRSRMIFTSRHSAQQSLPPVEDPMDVSTKSAAAAPTATLAASMMMDAEGEGGGEGGDFAGGAGLRDFDEEDDFAHCPWRIPSLTREQSLARVVAALGAEQGASAQQGGVGSGFEGSYGAPPW